MDLGKIPRPTWLEIDLDRLEYNIKNIRGYVDKDVKILAVVKGNAYGHGAVECGKLFLKNGADMLGVATLVEGIELREAGINGEILILGYTQDSELHKLVSYNITPMVFSYEQAKILSEESLKYNRKTNIHIKINTGMSRLGFSVNEKSLDDIQKISKLRGVNIGGMYSHFLQSDIRDKSITKDQFRKFIWISDKLKERGIKIPIRHISNSGSVLDNPEHNLEMVRVGQLLYGIYPSDQVNKSNVNLRFASEFKTRVADYRTIKKGTLVGYDKGFKASNDMKIACIPVGYADGYTPEMDKIVGPKYNNKVVKRIGDICMDQCMIDISNIGPIKINDIITLYGYDDKEMRAQLIVRIGRRVPRVYMKNKKIETIINYL